jgi:hypothetical protein
MDREIVEKWFERYPKLETFIGAGTISLKMARQILEVDRYFMYDMYLELVTAGAVYASGSNAFRATKDLQAFLEARRGASKCQ